MKLLKRAFSLLLAMIFVFAGTSIVGASPVLMEMADIAGIYEGTSLSANGNTTYYHTLTLNTDGTYSCHTEYSMTIQGEAYSNTETETGTYILFPERILYSPVIRSYRNPI